MSAITVTRHATARMQQRGIPSRDAELIVLIGTAVEDGYLVRAKDVQEALRDLKRLMSRITHLEGKRLVMDGNNMLTAYPTNRRKQRRLLRGVREDNL